MCLNLSKVELGGREVVLSSQHPTFHHCEPHVLGEAVLPSLCVVLMGWAATVPAALLPWPIIIIPFPPGHSRFSSLRPKLGQSGWDCIYGHRDFIYGRSLSSDVSKLKWSVATSLFFSTSPTWKKLICERRE